MRGPHFKLGGVVLEFDEIPLHHVLVFTIPVIVLTGRKALVQFEVRIDLIKQLLPLDGGFLDRSYRGNGLMLQLIARLSDEVEHLNQLL